MRVNGEVVGEGTGSAILGHPFEALAWLARSLNACGRALRAGEIVLLGSLVQTHWVAEGDHVEIELDGLGQASATFT